MHDLTRPFRAHPLRWGTAAVLALASMGISTAAHAHVHVEPGSAPAGAESTELTFRVPTESETAGTIKLEIALPADHPLPSVAARSIAGWTVTTQTGPLPTPVTVDGTRLTEAVRSVTWTANPGVRIGPGEYQDFQVSVGPMPESGRLVLPATQTYDDGHVVAWSTVQQQGQPEPEHPAPQVTITASAAPASDPGAGSASDGVARGLAGAGLVVALAGLGGVVALLRRRPGDPS